MLTNDAVANAAVLVWRNVRRLRLRFEQAVHKGVIPPVSSGDAPARKSLHFENVTVDYGSTPKKRCGTGVLGFHALRLIFKSLFLAWSILIFSSRDCSRSLRIAFCLQFWMTLPFSARLLLLFRVT